MKSGPQLTQLIFDQDTQEAHLFVGHDLTTYQYSTVINGYANSDISETLATKLKTLTISNYDITIETHPHNEVKELLRQYKHTH